MKEITDEEYDLFKKLTKIWFHTQPDKTGSFFICGEAGDHDENGLPDIILVCPQMGANITAVYKRDLVGRSGDCKANPADVENAAADNAWLKSAGGGEM